MVPYWSSAYVLWLLAWCCYGPPDSKSCCISDSFACSWYSFPSICFLCLALRWGFSFCVIVSCPVLFDSHLSDVCLFLKWKQTGSGSWGERGTRRGEGRADCGLVLLYERILDFSIQNLKKKSQTTRPKASNPKLIVGITDASTLELVLTLSWLLAYFCKLHTMNYCAHRYLFQFFFPS